MIKNIIFDVGKVLVSYEPEQMMRKLGFTEEEINIVNDAMFCNPLWDESDCGLRSKEEYHQAFLKQNPQHRDIIQKAYDHVGDTIELLSYGLDWIRGLKNRGYKVYILSNYAEYTLEVTRDKLKFIPLMDGIIFSYSVRMGKPDPEIYKRLLSDFNIRAEESVFIDDRKENIDAAEKLGIRGIQFKSYEQADRDLHDILGTGEIIRKHLSIQGSVQGVGFRYRAEHAAGLLGITGWVKNEPDGSVTLEVQGTQEAIDRMLVMIEQGTYVEIGSIRQKTIPVQEERYFKIR